MFFFRPINYWFISCETVHVSNGLMSNVTFFYSFFQYFLSSVFVTSHGSLLNTVNTKVMDPFNNNLNLYQHLEVTFSRRIGDA